MATCPAQLEEIKAKRGLAVEDGTLAPSKPLAEVLREAKEKKEQDFQDLWKQMKQVSALVWDMVGDAAGRACPVRMRSLCRSQ